MTAQTVTHHSPPWARHLASAAPALAFLVVLLATRDFRLATEWIVGLSAAALALVFALERRISPLQGFSGGAAIIFGGASLAFHRNDILQMKMTIVDTLLGAGLVIGLMLKKNPLKMMLGQAIALPDEAWRALTIRYAAFFFACAIANEIVRRTQTAEVWATFRVVAIVAAVVFGAAQAPLLRKYWPKDDHVADAAEPPEPGF
jgi:intracellular septation protein